MQISIFLARLMGVFAIVMGLSMLLKRRMLLGVFHELSSSRALSYILGVIIFLIGILIVLNHNIWILGFPLVITIMGWFVLIEGIAYLFVSKKTLAKTIALLDKNKFYYGIAIGYLILGYYLAYSVL